MHTISQVGEGRVVNALIPDSPDRQLVAVHDFMHWDLKRHTLLEYHLDHVFRRIYWNCG